MLAPSSQETGHTLLLIEAGLTFIAIAAAFAWPRLGATFFSRLERAFARLARRKSLAVVAVGLSAFFLRLAILPLCPIPLPFIPDDFSFLLAADTFLHGRLTNPTPAMWAHFESLHITMQPTYMSMYFPAQGLAMAAGKLVFGHPWFGILAASALMCAAICWMLQAWLPPAWALLGGFLAVLRLGLFSYWINTYSGAGFLAAIGGALVLGSLPRIMRGPRQRHTLLLAAGIVLVGTTRPYEGLLLCLPTAAVLGRWLLMGKNRPPARELARLAAAPLALLIAAGAWMGYYDYRAFGSPATLPYSVDRATYAVAPYYVWQSKRPAPVYRHESLRRFYVDFEPIEVDRIQSIPGFIRESLLKLEWSLTFFAGVALLPPLFMLRRVFRDRRIRFLVLCVLLMTAGVGIEIYLIPHYVAPFTPAFYAIGLQAMRHLRFWSPGDQPVGATLVRLTVTLCLLTAGLRLVAGPLRLMVPEWPAGEWSSMWFGPGYFGTERAGIEASLEQLPGPQLVLVRYARDHYPLDEWVYNGAEIDGAKVIWAREMDGAKNLELIHYYRGRQVWLAQPDAQAAKLSPYAVPEQAGAIAPQAGHRLR